MFTPKLWVEPQLASFWLAVKSLPIHVTHMPVLRSQAPGLLSCLQFREQGLGRVLCA